MGSHFGQLISCADHNKRLNAGLTLAGLHQLIEVQVACIAEFEPLILGKRSLSQGLYQPLLFRQQVTEQNISPT